MTPEIEKKRRELFEAHIKESHPDDYAEDGDQIFKREGAGYEWHWVNEFWLCFNAALGAVEIELPSKFDNAPPYACYEGGWNDMHDEAVDAITATGLGLKVKP